MRRGNNPARKCRWMAGIKRRLPASEILHRKKTCRGSATSHTPRGFEMKTWRDIKSKVAYLRHRQLCRDAVRRIEFQSVKKDRYSALCPFHSDTKDCLEVYVNKEDVVRFHCFGACKGDWDIFDMIMLGKKCGFLQAQQAWAEYLGIRDFRPDAGHSPWYPGTRRNIGAR